MRLHPLASSFGSVALMNFFSSTPKQIQATPLSCRSSVPTTSENSSMIRRQSLDFNRACVNGTKNSLSCVAQGNIVPQLRLDEASALYKTVQDRHSQFVRGQQPGAIALGDLSSRPSATLEAIKRSDTSAFEIAGQCMMRLVTSQPWWRAPLQLQSRTLP